ncbi:hypothetical protein L596_027420 [Steinernema carpocapsae]|uniref:Uncharacterized protein n=1 Tax=Steinernema carpocapsae TaxID=34508 RepID=A0A4U5M4A4_STECR|nr:hypothetical protein L596_027420 [Steinernema carpocapsae]
MSSHTEDLFDVSFEEVVVHTTEEASPELKIDDLEAQNESQPSEDLGAFLDVCRHSTAPIVDALEDTQDAEDQDSQEAQSEASEASDAFEAEAAQEDDSEPQEELLCEASFQKIQADSFRDLIQKSRNCIGALKIHEVNYVQMIRNKIRFHEENIERFQETLSHLEGEDYGSFCADALFAAFCGFAITIYVLVALGVVSRYFENCC